MIVVALHDAAVPAPALGVAGADGAVNAPTTAPSNASKRTRRQPRSTAPLRSIAPIFPRPAFFLVHGRLVHITASGRVGAHAGKEPGIMVEGESSILTMPIPEPFS